MVYVVTETFLSVVKRSDTVKLGKSNCSEYVFGEY